VRRSDLACTAWVRTGLATVLSVGLLTACASAARRAAPPAPTTPPTVSTLPATTPAPTEPPTTPTSRTTTTTTPAPATTGAGSEWLTYHVDNARLGVAATQPSLDPLHLAWRAPLDGMAVYGQPLVADGRVLVATEGDDIFALNAANGRVDWEVNIGDPLRNVASEAGCGDIDPLGITSTPVIDPATNTIYAVGEVSTEGSQPVHHQLVGINLESGREILSVDADPPLAGENSVHLLQRPGLALANGRVYIGFGGNYGDCATYHGWVVGITVPSAAPPAGPVIGSAPTVSFDVTPEGTGGAVWQGGAGISVDAAGSVYVSTGNPNSGGAAPWAESVLKLSPGLSSPPEHWFQDVTATGDEDLSTGDPILLPNGDVFAVGKTDRGYLLRQSDLGEVAVIHGTVCGSDPDGGESFDSATDSIYVPCRDGGIQQVNLAALATGWRAGDVNSAPILVDGELWAVSYPTGTLQEINPANGAVIQSTEVSPSVPNFASPTSARGLLLVGTTSGVAAFAGPGGPAA
jgi:polyvinyl alcohol dehydrogenase (cytochrome)